MHALAAGQVTCVRPSGNRAASAGRVQFQTPIARISRFCVSNRAGRAETVVALADEDIRHLAKKVRRVQETSRNGCGGSDPQRRCGLRGAVEVDVTVGVRVKSQLGSVNAEVHKRAVVRARFVVCVLRQLGRICCDQSVFLR